MILFPIPLPNSKFSTHWVAWRCQLETGYDAESFLPQLFLLNCILIHQARARFNSLWNIPSSHSTENVWLRVALLQCPCKRRGWSSRIVSCEFRIQGSTPYSRTMARNQSLWVFHFLDQHNVLIIFAATSPLQIISNSSSSKREI